MKVAAPFPLNEKRREKIDEYNIEFNIGEHKEDNLINWIKKPHVQEKRINLSMRPREELDTIDVDTLVLLNNIHPNLYLCLSFGQHNWISEYKKRGLKFFFNDGYSANSFCRLKDLIDLGVTDVYIAEDVCYNLSQTRKICDKAGVQIRFIANSISSFAFNKGTDPTAPWYVPENMPTLENFYDVIEFELFNSWNRFDVLYKIWIEKQEWDAELKYINFDLELNIPGEYFINELCIYKMQCEHRCLTKGHSCHKCQQYIEVAQMIEIKVKNWVEDNNDELIESIF